MEKTIPKSLTIWVNGISLIAMLIQSQTGFIVGPEAQAALLTIINMILRFKTTKPLKKIKDGGLKLKSLLIILSTVMLFGIGNISHASESGPVYTPNLTVDAVFTFNGYTLQGIGTVLAESKDKLINLKLGFAGSITDSEAPNYTTIGLGINLDKGFKKIGWNWIADTLNPEMGISALFDLNGPEKSTGAIYINAIQWEHDLFK